MKYLLMKAFSSIVATNFKTKVFLWTECTITKPVNGDTDDGLEVYISSETITFKCNDDYTLIGDKTRTCNDGELSEGTDVTCHQSELKKVTRLNKLLFIFLATCCEWLYINFMFA